MRHATPRNALADCFFSDMRAMVAGGWRPSPPVVPRFCGTALQASPWWSRRRAIGLMDAGVAASLCRLASSAPEPAAALSGRLPPRIPG